jgi:hypothetical protein
MKWLLETVNRSVDQKQRIGHDLVTAIDDLNPKSVVPGLATGRVRWHALASLIILAACLAEFLTEKHP